MTLFVRDLRAADPADAEAFVEVRRLALPFMVSTAESLLHDATQATPEAHYRQLVAEADGEVIGTVQTGIADDSPVPGQGYLNVYVHPDHLRRGAGGLLVRAAEERLTAVGAKRLLSWVLDAPENRAFAERRGYAPSRSAHFLRLDLAHGTLPRSGPRPTASSCARPPTSPTTHAPCSTWTRRPRRMSPATSTRSSTTTSCGSRRPFATRCWTTP